MVTALVLCSPQYETDDETTRSEPNVRFGYARFWLVHDGFRCQPAGGQTIPRNSAFELAGGPKVTVSFVKHDAGATRGCGGTGGTSREG